MLTPTHQLLALAALAFLAIQCDSLVQPSSKYGTTVSRREAWNLLISIPATSAVMWSLLTPAPPALAADGVILTDEEMKARIARKLELQKGPSSNVRSATDVRSDVNPEAGENLRSRSVLENTKIALEKQEELKRRDKMQKRDDMCEMLGRGC